MTEEILYKMEDRRRVKEPQKYKRINKQIQREVQRAKDAWMQSQCEEIESYQIKHDLFNVYRKVREVTGQGRERTIGCLTDKY